MGKAAILCSGLTKRYRRYSATRPRRFKDLLFGGWKRLNPIETLCALDDVSFRLESGRMLGVVGCNGAGKSTLLRLVGGVSRPDAGTVTTHGRLGALLDLALGFHPDLTGRENAIISGVMGGLTRREVLNRLERVVEFAELEDFIDAPLRTYSTGMRMRLGFAMAVHAEPEILLIDEVLAVGDLRFKRKCTDRISRLKTQGTAVLLVSHSPQEVEDLCDEALWLDGGQVRVHGDAGQVMSDYRARMSDTGNNKVPVSARGEALQPHQQRMGSLEMEITGVRLLDREGRPLRVLPNGSAFEIHIDYLPHERIENPIFQVKLVREDGSVAWMSSTAAAGADLPDLDAPGRLRLRIDHQHLAKGDYFVNVGAYSPGWKTIFDFQAGQYRLTVDSPYGGRGVMDLPVRWDLIEDSGAEGHPAVRTAVP